jgi:hypothetical protein
MARPTLRGSMSRLLRSTNSSKTALPANLAGELYIPCLARIHFKARPRTYLEIGTLAGQTLSMSRCRSVAVDPEFRISEPLLGAIPFLFLFQGTSDEFFRNLDPKAVLGGPIDLAFLDGMHLFEFLLRDFINTERNCHRGSMVILHDCMPLDLAMTGRDMGEVLSRPNARHPGWWTGDVWKTADILIRYRPDLDIIALDAPPTGLIIIRNLDPGSATLESRYQAIVEEYSDRQNISALTEYFKRLKVGSTSIVETFEPIDLNRTATRAAGQG